MFPHRFIIIQHRIHIPTPVVPGCPIKRTFLLIRYTRLLKTCIFRIFKCFRFTCRFRDTELSLKLEIIPEIHIDIQIIRNIIRLAFTTIITQIFNGIQGINCRKSSGFQILQQISILIMNWEIGFH